MNHVNCAESQRTGFINLVSAVNRIPKVHITLEKSPDLQRDALAFVVDSIYRQFKETNWQLMVEEIPKKVDNWNNSTNSFKATASLLQLIRHLFEFRITEMISTANLNADEINYLKIVKTLFDLSATTALRQDLKQNQPVFFGGIPRSLLPEWYLREFSDF